MENPEKIEFAVYQAIASDRFFLTEDMNSIRQFGDLTMVGSFDVPIRHISALGNLIHESSGKRLNSVRAAIEDLLES